MSQLVQPNAAPLTGPELDNRRILAALIDIGLLIPVALVLFAVLGDSSGAIAPLIGGWSLFYYFALESGDGQTIGKRVMKLRVVRADGGPLDMGRVAVQDPTAPDRCDGAYCSASSRCSRRAAAASASVIWPRARSFRTPPGRS